MISRSLFGFAILAVAAALSDAAPLKYVVSMTAPADLYSTLSGADVTLEFQWDSAPLTPAFDRPTVGIGQWLTLWPTSNTTVQVRVDGSGQHDGEYPGMFLGAGYWELTNGDQFISDNLLFPDFLFNLDGRLVGISNLRARFDDSFYGQPTISPRPFTASEVEWVAPFFSLVNSGEGGLATNVTGSAAPVPEPTAAALAAVAACAITPLRRRKEPAALPRGGGV